MEIAVEKFAVNTDWIAMEVCRENGCRTFRRKVNICREETIKKADIELNLSPR